MKRVFTIILALVLLISLAVPVCASAYEDSAVGLDGKQILICLGIGLVLALITVGVMAAQLKSVRRQNSAGSYIRSGSMKVTQQQDIYMYQNTIRRKREQKK